MKPQKLTVRKVKAAARRAYAERRLTAQHRNPAKRDCVYTSGAYHCAIGCALNKQSLQMIDEERLNHGTPVGLLQSHDVITVDNDDINVIDVIQNLHDEWAQTSQSWGANSKVTRQARAEFLASIGLK